MGTPVRTLAGPFGGVRISQVEELIVERVLVSKHPLEYPPALDCAKKILAAALQQDVEVDWAEVKRLAKSSAYSNWPDVKAITNEQAEALELRIPYDPNE